MTYRVFYKRTWWPFWRKYKGVTGDYLQYNNHMDTVPGTRVLELQDGTRVEMPTTYCFKFSPERKLIIEQNKQKEIRQGGN